MIKFTDNVPFLNKQFNQFTRVIIPGATKAAAEDAMIIMTNAGREHIPGIHRALSGQSDEVTGRLWSGWGDRNAGVQTNNPESNERDNVALIRTRGNNSRYHIIVGTRVPYAFYANDGRPDNQGRTRWGFREATIKESRELILPAYEARMSEAFAETAQGKRAVRSYNAAKRRRSSTRGSVGQFAKST